MIQQPHLILLLHSFLLVIFFQSDSSREDVVADIIFFSLIVLGVLQLFCHVIGLKLQSLNMSSQPHFDVEFIYLLISVLYTLSQYLNRKITQK